MNTERRLVAVFAGNLVDADFVRMMLEAEEIPVYLQDEHMGQLAPWYVTAAGAGAVKVLVAEDDLTRAEEVLRDFLEGDADE
mgnify:CR=1 FL=1